MKNEVHTHGKYPDTGNVYYFFVHVIPPRITYQSSEWLKKHLNYHSYQHLSKLMNLPLPAFHMIIIYSRHYLVIPSVTQ